VRFELRHSRCGAGKAICSSDTINYEYFEKNFGSLILNFCFANITVENRISWTDQSPKIIFLFTNVAKPDEHFEGVKANLPVSKVDMLGQFVTASKMRNSMPATLASYSAF